MTDGTDQYQINNDHTCLKPIGSGFKHACDHRTQLCLHWKLQRQQSYGK